MTPPPGFPPRSRFLPTSRRGGARRRCAQGLGSGASLCRLRRSRRDCRPRLRCAAPQSVVGLADGRGEPARRADRHAAPRARPRCRGDRGVVQRRALCAGAVDGCGEGGARSAIRSPTRRRMFEGDYPDWLDPHFARVFGDERAAEGAALASRAPLDMRVNTLVAEREEVLPKLAHLDAEPTRWSPAGLRIRLAADAKSPAIHAEPPFAKARSKSRTRARSSPRCWPAPSPASRSIDLCAGAGGKTLALAAAMENRGQIYATDIDKRQLAPIHERIARAGARNIQVRTPRGDGGRACRSRRPRRSGADRRAVHRHRHLAAQPRRQVAHPPGRAGRAGQTAGSRCSTAPRRWSSRAAASPTSPVRCWRRKTATRCGPLSAGTPDFSVEKPARVVVTALGERAYLFGRAALISDEGLLMTPRRTDTDGFFVSLLRRKAIIAPNDAPLAQARQPRRLPAKPP